MLVTAEVSKILQNVDSNISIFTNVFKTLITVMCMPLLLLLMVNISNDVMPTTSMTLALNTSTTQMNVTSSITLVLLVPVNAITMTDQVNEFGTIDGLEDLVNQDVYVYCSDECDFVNNVGTAWSIVALVLVIILQEVFSESTDMNVSITQTYLSFVR